MNNNRKHTGCLKSFGVASIVIALLMIAFGAAIWIQDNNKWKRWRAENAEWYAQHEKQIDSVTLHQETTSTNASSADTSINLSDNDKVVEEGESTRSTEAIETTETVETTGTTGTTEAVETTDTTKVAETAKVTQTTETTETVETTDTTGTAEATKTTDATDFTEAVDEIQSNEQPPHPTGFPIVGLFSIFIFIVAMVPLIVGIICVVIARRRRRW